MMELKLVEELKKDNMIGKKFEIGGYKIMVVTKTDDADYLNIDIKSDCNAEYAPEIYFTRELFGEIKNEFGIQTTSYGAKSVSEMQKVIAGYQEAIEVVEILTKEFIEEATTEEVIEAEETVECWRVYVEGEIAGTFFNSTQAYFMASDYFGAGYTAEQVEVVKEDYELG